MAIPRLKWGRGEIDDLVQRIDMYFASCSCDEDHSRDRMPTVLGLCIALGITDDTWYYYVSGRYISHTPSYIRERLPDDEVVDQAPSADDMAAVDAFDWPKYMAITGDSGDPREWSMDQRLRRAIGVEFKRAAMRIAESQAQEGFRLQRMGKQAIFSMFALKAFSGFREDAPQLAAPQQEATGETFRLVVEGAAPLAIEAPNPGSKQPTETVEPAPKAGLSVEDPFS